VAAIGGAAVAAVLGWLLFGRHGGTTIDIARTEPTVTEPTAARREATPPVPTAMPAEPTAAPVEPTAAPVQPTVAPPTAVPPTAVPASPTEPPLAPLSLASARPSGKSITIRVGAQQRFEASLKNAHDAVLVWRVGPDAVGQGETFVFGKPFSETPGKKTVELVGSRGHGPETLRQWEVEIEAPPLGFGRLDPPTPSVERDVGSRVTFRAPIAQPKGDALAFQWEVNGETASGIDGSSYEFEPSRPGDYVVAVRATAPWGASIANTWKLSVRQPPPPPPPSPSTREMRPPTDTKTAEAQAQAWIEAYCNAFQTKDTDALIALGHLSNEAEAARLREALKAMTNLRVSCSNQTVRVTGDQAVVSFDRTDHWIDPRGSEMERALPRITKKLRRNDGRWVAQ
jgi:hypothetical protein